MNRDDVQRTRGNLRTAEDELTRASHLLAALSEFGEKRRRGADADADAVVSAFETFLRPGPGRDLADRRSALGYLAEPHVEHDGTETDFFAAARDYLSDGQREPPDDQDTSAGGTSLSALLSALEAYAGTGSGGGSGDGSATPEEAVETFATLIESGSAAMAGHLRTLGGLLAEAARGRRDTLRADLNEEVQGFLDGYPRDADDGSGEPIDDPIQELGNEPIALLPVRLETRFVDGDLLVRVYPDAIHTDSHEPQLTDAEVRWGRNFWAYVWEASHEGAGGAALETNLPADRHDELVAMLDGLDEAGYPDDAAARATAIKERIWKQLVDRFGRERAAYVVHATTPTVEGRDDGPQFLLRPDATATDVGALTFPDADRKPGSWTRPPFARLLPDRWIVYGAWVGEEYRGDTERDWMLGDGPATWSRRDTFVKKTGAIREPLAVGPTPEAIAVAEQYGGDTDTPTSDAESDGMAWITEFAAAEQAGMAFRITPEDVFGAHQDVSFSEGRFETLIVTGAKASMDATATAERLEALFDAHHYTHGLEFVRQGTPTNNADRESGYSSSDAPEESMAVEASPPLVQHGDNTDGDRLARALAIDPASTGSDGHVFAHVENADATEGLDAWHMNSALWSGTLGYYLQNMMLPNKFTPFGRTLPDMYEGAQWTSEHLVRNWLEEQEPAGWYEAVRRHFINYVRARGPLPSFRADTQPYGVLPATVLDDDSADRLWAEFVADPPAGYEGEGGGPTTGESSDGLSESWLGDSDGEGSSTADSGGVNDPAREFQAIPDGRFRSKYSVEEAIGSIPEEGIARIYDPREAARVFTSEEIATHYGPGEAASVLSEDELARYYTDEELAAAEVEVGGEDGEGS